MASMPKSSTVGVGTLRERLLLAQRRHAEAPSADTLAEYRKALRAFTGLVMYGRQPSN